MNRRSACLVCGAQMDARRSTRRYCSTRCRLAHYRNPGLSVTNPGLWATAEHEPPAETTTPLSHAIPAHSAAPRYGNGALAAIAAGIATPADEYGPARAYCEVRVGGYGVVFGRDGGRVHEPVGPVFPRPRKAIDLANLLNQRITTA